MSYSTLLSDLLLKLRKSEENRAVRHVAATIDVSRSSISAYEHGALPSAEHLAILLDVYGADIETRKEAWRLRTLATGIPEEFLPSSPPPDPSASTPAVEG